MMPAGNPTFVCCEPLPKVSHQLPPPIVCIFKREELLTMRRCVFSWFFLRIHAHHIPMIIVVIQVIREVQTPHQVFEAIQNQWQMERTLMPKDGWIRQLQRTAVTWSRLQHQQWPKSGAPRTLMSCGRRRWRDQLVINSWLRSLLDGHHDLSKGDFHKSKRVSMKSKITDEL